MWNPRLEKHERAMRILRMHANEREPLEEAKAGDIVALVGLKSVATGDTLCDKAQPVALEAIRFPEPVISMAIEPKSGADKDRLDEALARLSREDPTFHTRVHEETGQTIIAGMGELHLEVLRNRLTRDFGVQANVGPPRVSYRQAILAPATASFTFQRTIAGKEQTATVELAVEPRRGGPAEVEVVNRAPPTAIPPRFVPSVLEGVRFAASGGLDLGFPVIEAGVVVTGGRFHETDSTDVAFGAAASEAFAAACETAGLEILEPIMRLEVTTPAEFTGGIQSDLVRRGALLEGEDVRGSLRVIRGRVPLSRMFGYSTVVRSLSQGRASYAMEPAGFGPVSAETARSLSFGA
jgi:elongation factor G